MPPIDPGAPTKLSYQIELRGGRQRAVCLCGWSSGWLVNAGIAGASWDRHVEVEHRAS